MGTFAELRRNNKHGPVKMFDHLYSTRNYADVKELATKVKTFFLLYSRNRHKMASMTPVFHYYHEGCDAGRLDLRPITYATDWGYQFEVIEERVRELEKQRNSVSFGRGPKVAEFSTALMINNYTQGFENPTTNE